MSKKVYICTSLKQKYIKETNKQFFKMTKADIVNEIGRSTGIDKAEVLTVVESFMEEVKKAMVGGDEVFLRGFGSFIIKRRAEKTARNISKGTSIRIPAHNIPAFKPAKTFLTKVSNYEPKATKQPKEVEQV